MSNPNGNHPLAALHLDAATLRPLIAIVVEQTLTQLDQDRATLPDKFAYSEAEAARLLSLNAHQLRDARLRGEIEASVGPGRKILYSRPQLLAYLAGRRWQGREITDAIQGGR